MDIAKVTSSAIPSTMPAVKSALLKTMFIKTFGDRQTIDKATVTAPAASSMTSKNAHTPINLFDTISPEDGYKDIKTWWSRLERYF
jgi:hypothetical protein